MLITSYEGISLGHFSNINDKKRSIERDMDCLYEIIMQYNNYSYGIPLLIPIRQKYSKTRDIYIEYKQKIENLYHNTYPDDTEKITDLDKIENKLKDSEAKDKYNQINSEILLKCNQNMKTKAKNLDDWKEYHRYFADNQEITELLKAFFAEDNLKCNKIPLSVVNKIIIIANIDKNYKILSLLPFKINQDYISYLLKTYPNNQKIAELVYEYNDIISSIIKDYNELYNNKTEENNAYISFVIHTLVQYSSTKSLLTDKEIDTLLEKLQTDKIQKKIVAFSENRGSFEERQLGNKTKRIVYNNTNTTNTNDSEISKQINAELAEKKAAEVKQREEERQKQELKEKKRISWSQNDNTPNSIINNQLITNEDECDNDFSDQENEYNSFTKVIDKNIRDIKNIKYYNAKPESLKGLISDAITRIPEKDRPLVEAAYNNGFIDNSEENKSGVKTDKIGYNLYQRIKVCGRDNQPDDKPFCYLCVPMVCDGHPPRVILILLNNDASHPEHNEDREKYLQSIVNKAHNNFNNYINKKEARQFPSIAKTKEQLEQQNAVLNSLKESDTQNHQKRETNEFLGSLPL